MFYLDVVFSLPQTTQTDCERVVNSMHDIGDFGPTTLMTVDIEKRKEKK